MYGWMRASRLGNLGLRAGSQTPLSAMTLNGELIQLRQQVKEQDEFLVKSHRDWRIVYNFAGELYKFPWISVNNTGV